MRSRKEIDASIQEEWDKIPAKGILPEEIKSRMWMNIQRATIQRRVRHYRWVAAACVVFLVSMAGYRSLVEHSFSPTPTIATKTYPLDIRLLRLPDGSRVWVNQNTEIEYPKQFAEDVRSITLKGEAFFEVMKDPSKPFIITSGEITTTVMGTSFNVKAYGGTSPEVRVRTGKVKVQGSQNTVFLERGFAAVLAPYSKTIKKQKTAVMEPEWKKVLIDVDGLTLEQVIEKLQPVHPFAIKYAEESLKDLKIKGTLDTRHGLVEMLQTVAFALDVEISPIGPGSYVIKK